MRFYLNETLNSPWFGSLAGFIFTHYGFGDKMVDFDTMKAIGAKLYDFQGSD